MLQSSNIQNLNWSFLSEISDSKFFLGTGLGSLKHSDSADYPVYSCNPQITEFKLRTGPHSGFRESMARKTGPLKSRHF